VRAPAVAGAHDHPGLLQLAENSVHSALRDSNVSGNLTDPYIGITSDTHQHMSMIAEERPC
jgi:hypothetical protein